MTSRSEDAVEQPVARIPPAAELEFEAMTRRLGIEVPPDLLGGVLHGYRALRDMTALLHGAGSAEPGDRAVEGTESSGA